MIQLSPSPVVHLEVHTGNLARACSFYSRVCGWRLEQVELGDCSYRAFDLGGGLEGGVVECGASRAVWIPYLGVSRIDAANGSHLPPRPTAHSDLTAMNSERRAALSRRHEGGQGGERWSLQ
jgi:catechol 2,3-dioxygenase-like lactoylglutathione lyase family enzyme